MTFYSTIYLLKLLMFVVLLGPGVTAPPGAVVVDVSPGFKGYVVASDSPGAVQIVMPGVIAATGPDKAACEKWGDALRRAEAARLKLKDYRQLKYDCRASPPIH